MTPISSLSQSSMLETMSLHKELSAGAIKPNRFDGIAGSENGPSFGQLMGQKVNQINHDQEHASGLMRAVDLGHSDDLIGAMVASQKADLTFSALVQVRNKLVSAFDEVMRMQL